MVARTPGPNKAGEADVKKGVTSDAKSGGPAQVEATFTSDEAHGRPLDLATLPHFARLYPFVETLTELKSGQTLEDLIGALHEAIPRFMDELALVTEPLPKVGPTPPPKQEVAETGPQAPATAASEAEAIAEPSAPSNAQAPTEPRPKPERPAISPEILRAAEAGVNQARQFLADRWSRTRKDRRGVQAFLAQDCAQALEALSGAKDGTPEALVNLALWALRQPPTGAVVRGAEVVTPRLRGILDHAVTRHGNAAWSQTLCELAKLNSRFGPRKTPDASHVYFHEILIGAADRPLNLPVSISPATLREAAEGLGSDQAHRVNVRESNPREDDLERGLALFACVMDSATHENTPGMAAIQQWLRENGGGAGISPIALARTTNYRGLLVPSGPTLTLAYVQAWALEAALAARDPLLIWISQRAMTRALPATLKSTSKEKDKYLLHSILFWTISIKQQLDFFSFDTIAVMSKNVIEEVYEFISAALRQRDILGFKGLTLLKGLAAVSSAAQHAREIAHPENNAALEVRAPLLEIIRQLAPEPPKNPEDSLVALLEALWELMPWARLEPDCPLPVVTSMERVIKEYNSRVSNSVTKNNFLALTREMEEFSPLDWLGKVYRKETDRRGPLGHNQAQWAKLVAKSNIPTRPDQIGDVFREAFPLDEAPAKA